MKTRNTLITTTLFLGLAACGGAPSPETDVPTVDGWRIYEGQYTLEVTRAGTPDEERQDDASLQASDGREDDALQASADAP